MIERSCLVELGGTIQQLTLVKENSRSVWVRCYSGNVVRVVKRHKVKHHFVELESGSINVDEEEEK
jgi:hypothetical protein